MRTRRARGFPKIALMWRGLFHPDLTRKDVDRHDPPPGVVALHITPLHSFRKMKHSRGMIADTERPLLQSKQRQEQNRVGIDEMEPDNIGPAGDKPTGRRSAFDKRCAIIEVLVRPHFKEQIAGPSAVHLDLNAGDAPGPGCDKQIPEVALKVAGQRTLGDLDDLPAPRSGLSVSHKGYVACALLVMVAGCAPSIIWTKVGATQPDFATDSYQCEKDARQSGYFGSGLAGAVNMQGFAERCMTAHGWRAQRAGAPVLAPQPLIPPSGE